MLLQFVTTSQLILYETHYNTYESFLSADKIVSKIKSLQSVVLIISATETQFLIETDR